MSYCLPPDIEARVRHFIESGAESSEAEVLRHALDALERHNEEDLAIQQGIDDIEAGRVSPLREFDADFRLRKNIPSDA